MTRVRAAAKPRIGTALATLAVAWSAFASGPEQYETPFVARADLEAALAGDFPERFRDRDAAVALAVYLHLDGRLTDGHAALFRSERLEAPARNYGHSFWQMAAEEGFQRPRGFATWKLRSRVYSDPSDPSRTYTIRQYVDNCQTDAFRTAEATLSDRRSRYGSGSVELSRWLDAQTKVFAQCSGEAGFVPPEDPAPDWLPLERFDREYQIAAAYFYAGEYLEAASRFGDIGQNVDSPWRDLGRYLVGRSLAREAIVNDNDPPRHLGLALNVYAELAEDPAYLAAFPSVPGQIRHIRTRMDPVATRRELEQRIIEAPASVSANELADYVYLRRWVATARANRETDYERWLWYATERRNSTPEGAVEQWRAEGSLPWLYIALARASSDLGETTLTELLTAAAALPDDAPGHLNMLLSRIRILGPLGRVDDGLRLAEEALVKGLDRSQINRVRLAAANVASNWPDYLRWASLKPLSLPWTDAAAARLPSNFNRITTDTTLFDRNATNLLNSYFTAAMIDDVIDTPGLSDYQRGRLAIAGWTKAMLADDVDLALKLSARIRRYVPRLEGDMARFEEGRDRHFEAARIVFDYPAFSPWMERGARRVYTGDRPYRQIPDHVTYGSTWGGWWCPAWRDHRIREGMLRGPRFAGYSDAELAAVRKVVDDRETAATSSFGPYVIRYAREHLDDPRVPRALHRLVFATRHACYVGRAPGRISQAAYALLHEHFPDSEWAAKTPYWYGRVD